MELIYRAVELSKCHKLSTEGLNGVVAFTVKILAFLRLTAIFSPLRLTEMLNINLHFFRKLKINFHCFKKLKINFQNKFVFL